ncbi:filamin-A-like [Xenia sp. Carnegie-2017]|uniref:filamin-A-like n=1 Tax=Xenia sp. Carnegie-2017 TaxID=2897299 RepID=UPI001F03C8BE|nr:filamin-A-like [Xenia sp. Carnegie-2017]
MEDFGISDETFGLQETDSEKPYIKLAGLNARSSTFLVKIANPRNILVESLSKEEIRVGNEVIIPLKVLEEAGEGELEAEIIAPGNVVVESSFVERKENLHHLRFVPAEPVEYIIKLFFNGKEIGASLPGSTVADPGKAVAHGEGLYQVRLHEQVEFLVSLHGAGKGQLAITAVSPFGETVPVQIKPLESEADTYVIYYTPQEIGDHKIFVKFAGVNVRGSPFVVKVADPSKVLVQNLSEDEMTVGNEVIIPLEVLEEAGEGELEAEILAPGNVTVESSFVQRMDNLYHLRFVPTVPGEYEIKILFGGGLVPGQPMKVDVTELYISPDASKCIVYGDGLKECDVNKPGEFTVDCRDAGEGLITSTLQGVQYTTMYVKVEDNGNGTYDCRYVASIPGTYALHVLFDGDNVPGSPFTVEIVGEPELSQCTVEGKALTTGGFVDEPIKLTVITGSSDTGVLAVRCDGPSKDCDANAQDNHNGTYTLIIHPTESGLHSIHIEWGGQPVQGSPFEVNVVDRPNATNIVAVGPGVENGVIKDFEGKFVIDTKGAGAGALKIKIRGPKAFDLKCIKKKLKDRNVAVEYSPSQAGQYDISVTWLGEDISGSPYTVYIAESTKDVWDSRL